MIRTSLLVAGALAVLSGSADAADAGAVSPYNWTGCYLGAHAGGGSAQSQLFDTTPQDMGSPGADGWLGGGQIGCDRQFGVLVLGVEGKFSWAGLNGTVPYVPNPPTNLRSNIEQLGTATARIGYAAHRVLLYVKGGFAWSKSNYRSDQPPSTGFAAAISNRSGWVIGGGIDYAFAPNWSLNLEYSHFDFGTQRDTFICSPTSFCGVPSFVADTTQRVDTVMVGINYRFGSPGGPAY